MNNSKYTLFTPEFNGSVKIEARPERLTSEGGAILLREIIQRLKITEDLARELDDTRNPEIITHELEELLNTIMILYGQGWRDQDDADELRDDPAMRLSASTRRGVSPLLSTTHEEEANASREPDGLASQPTFSRLVRMLGSEGNRTVLRGFLLETASRRLLPARGGHRMRYLTIDVDSLPIDVAGHQPESAYNGHYHARIYHTLVASIAETGDMIDAVLREGNASCAKGATEFILSLIDNVEERLCQVAAVRIDAGFPDEKLLGALEKRKTPYVVRVKSNAVLDSMAAEHLRRPVGRPTREPRIWVYEKSYRARTWSHERRLVLVVLERPGELFLDYFWLITNWSVDQMDGTQLLEQYRRRGLAEARMGELKDVLDPALSSSPRPKTHYRNEVPRKSTASVDSFAVNEVILLLNMLAYNVVHTARMLLEQSTDEGWSLRRLRERLLRVAARLVLHGRRVIVVINERTAALWSSLWPKLRRLRWGPA
jgi:hypothetical protein